MEDGLSKCKDKICLGSRPTGDRSRRICGSLAAKKRARRGIAALMPSLDPVLNA